MNGWGWAALAGGGILVWSSLNGKNVTATLQDLLQGHKPTPAPEGISPGTGLGIIPAGNPGSTTGTGAGRITPRQAYVALRQAGIPATAAVMLTAIGGVESGWNLQALNNTPATGDYSIGVWQINYFGSLGPGRTKEFGPPSALLGNLSAQAAAVAILYRQAGLQPWGPDISSGKVNKFLSVAAAAAAGGP